MYVYILIGRWRLMSQKKKQQTSHSIQFNSPYRLEGSKNSRKREEEKEREKKTSRRRNGGKTSSRNCSSESESEFVSFLTVTGELQLLLTVHLLLYNYYYSMATTNQY